MMENRFSQQFFVALESMKLKILLILVAAGSFVVGMIGLIRSGKDCQIEGSRFLIQNKSPYHVFLTTPGLFRHTRLPTHLPQEYYLLSIFNFFGDKAGYLLYGLCGVGSIFLLARCYKKNRNYLFVVLLLLSTVSFRNNIANGQFAFFFLGFFLLLNYLIEEKIQKDMVAYLVVPVLLLFLIAKITLFFWIPLYYRANKRLFISYLIAGGLQCLSILVFILQTHTTLYGFLAEYKTIIMGHSSLMGSAFNVFGISFKDRYMIVNSMLVFLNMLTLLFNFGVSRYTRQAIGREYWLFACLLLGFILIYHRNYDVFLLLLPLLLFNGINDSFLYLAFLFIVENIVVRVFDNNYYSLVINNFGTNVLCLLIQLTLSGSLIKERFNEKLVPLPGAVRRR